jgi:hypothetical protein
MRIAGDGRGTILQNLRESRNQIGVIDEFFFAYGINEQPTSLYAAASRGRFCAIRLAFPRSCSPTPSKA